MAFVYIVRCVDASLYTGWTLDWEKRLAKHNAGTGAKYTRGRLPVALVYLESVPLTAARKREAAIKKLSREQKLALIGKAATRRELEQAAKHWVTVCKLLED